jgi:hypothetical protein
MQTQMPGVRLGELGLMAESLTQSRCLVPVALVLPAGLRLGVEVSAASGRIAPAPAR